MSDITHTTRQPICPSCGGRHPRLKGRIPPINIFAGRELPYALDNGFLYECDKCALGFRHPQLEQSVLDELYRAGSPDFWQSEPVERVDWSIAARLIERTFPDGKVFDIGCFDGGFLAQLGPRTKKFGIEINQEAANRARARGIKIVGDNFETITPSIGQFDAVVAMDVIEHVKDPLQFLRKLSDITVNGGLIFISTGNTDAFTWRLRGSKYWYCAIAEHIAYINPRWCKTAASTLNLDLRAITEIPHLRWRWRRGVAELVANVLYMLSPGTLDFLRHRGYGHRKPQYALQLKYPPSWTTAKDHIAVVFRKR